MLSNQQLYLVNHFALVARHHGIHLPDLKELLADLPMLRRHVEAGLAPGADPAVTEAAAKLAAAMAWRPSTAGGGATDGMTAAEFARARAALVSAAGPIAEFIADRIDPMATGMSLARFVDEAAALAQLDAARHRALRRACGLPEPG